MTRSSFSRFLMLGAAIIATNPLFARTAANVDQQRLLNADAEQGQWMSYGRTYNEQRFSPLDEIEAALAQ
jgi:quinohemoprotein ethanol dehydrogenase